VNAEKMKIEQILDRNRIVYVGLAALLISLLAPLCFVDVPPLMDFPNHLARLWLLTGGAARWPANNFYAIDWSGVRTNIGIDLMAITVGRAIPYAVLGKIVVAMAVILPPLGAVALNTKLFPNFGVQRILLLLSAWMLNLFLGFLNFQIGLGLALLFAVAEWRISRLPQALAFVVRAVISTSLLIVHPFALIFYAALLAGLGLGREPIEVRDPSMLIARLKSAVWRASATIVPVILFAATPGRRLGASHLSNNWVFNDPLNIPLTLLSPFRSYSNGTDVVCGLSAVLIVYYASTRGRLIVHTGLILTSAALFTAAIFMPKHTPFAAGIHLRLPPMALIALMTSFDLRLASARRMMVVSALAASLVCFRTADISWKWHGGQVMSTSVARALDSLPMGSRLVVAALPPTSLQLAEQPPGRFIGGSTPSYSHLGELATPLRGAFLPGLFAEPGKQPIVVRSAYFDSAVLSGGELIGASQLSSPDLDFGDGWLIRKWRTRFDYALLLNADAESGARDRLAPGLTLIADRGFARLYRIDR
jgi:hypothetical protein